MRDAVPILITRKAAQGLPSSGTALQRVRDQFVARGPADRLTGVDTVAQVLRQSGRLRVEELGPVDDLQVGVARRGFLQLLVDPRAVGPVGGLDVGALAEPAHLDVHPVHRPLRTRDRHRPLDLRPECRRVEDVVGADRHHDPAGQAVVARPARQRVDRRGRRLTGPVVDGDRVAGPRREQLLQCRAVLDGGAVAEHEDPVERQDVPDLVVGRDPPEQVLPRAERARTVAARWHRGGAGGAARRPVSGRAGLGGAGLSSTSSPPIAVNTASVMTIAMAGAITDSRSLLLTPSTPPSFDSHPHNLITR